MPYNLFKLSKTVGHPNEQTFVKELQYHNKKNQEIVTFLALLDTGKTPCIQRVISFQLFEFFILSTD